MTQNTPAFMPSTTTVNATPISLLPEAALPLSGTELVAVVQNGETLQTTVEEIAGSVSVDVEISAGAGITVTEPVTNEFTISMSDMPEETFKGRAPESGTGAPVNLTRAQGNIGYLNVPPIEIATRNLLASDAGCGIVQPLPNANTITIRTDSDEDLGLGFVTTLACADAGGSITVQGDPGVTIVDFGTGDTGDEFIIDGVGIATLWHLGTDTWGIHGSNVELVP